MSRRHYTRNRVPPEVHCRGGCGRSKRTWTRSWLCRFCLLEDREVSPLSFREWRHLHRSGEGERSSERVVATPPQADVVERREEV